MPALVTPSDGRITSQNILASPTVTGDAVMEIVWPGNAAQGNTYQISLLSLAQFFASSPALAKEIVTSGATSGSPYQVPTNAGWVFFNKTVGSASYAQLPLSTTLLAAQPIFFKDMKGDAATNNITIQFTGEQCDGLTELSITTNYGWLSIQPIPPSGGAWYENQ